MKCSFENIMDNIAFFSQLIPDSQLSCVVSPGIHALTVFILACFVGYYVVWRVTPALHAPLMSVTNAISSVIIVGAIFAAVSRFHSSSTILGFIAIILASINIFGGFAITNRMLSMFRKK